MKIIFSGLLVICFLFMSACSSGGTITLTSLPNIEPSPSQTDSVQATASAETSPEAVVTQPNANDTDSNVTTPVDKYHAVVDGYEYYLDTSRPVIDKDLEDYDAYPDYPLMKKKAGDANGEFLGIYGCGFEVRNNYIYIDSRDFVAGDYESWTTRALSLKDGSVSKELLCVDLFFSPEKNEVYYVEVPGDTIYYCKPDLTVIKKYPVHVPDIKKILSTLKTKGYDNDIKEDYFEYYMDLEIKDGWIYFSYEMCEPPQLTAYKGNYRMSLDGTKIESTGEGTYSERTDYWGGDDEEDYADD